MKHICICRNCGYKRDEPFAGDATHCGACPECSTLMVQREMPDP